MRTYRYERVPFGKKPAAADVPEYQAGGAAAEHGGQEGSADVPAEDHYRLSDDDLCALGGGDPEVGHAALSAALPYAITERGTVPAWAITLLGGGDDAVGRKVMDRFIQEARAKDHGEKS
jgi:hypothetical protein